DKETLPQNIIEPSGAFKHRLLKSAAIYGANASGKSNFIKAIEFMTAFVRESVVGDNNTRIDVTPFAFDNECAGKPSLFEADFIHEGIRYVYGFTVDAERVHEEWLYSFPKGQQATLFERFLDEQHKPQYKFNRSLSKSKDLVGKTRHNSLFLTVATQFNVDFAGKINEWFYLFRPLPSIEYSMPVITSKMVLNDNNNKNLIVDFLKKADLEISDFEVEEKTIEVDETSIKMLRTLLKNLDKNGNVFKPPPSEAPKMLSEFMIKFHHRIRTSQGEETFMPMDFKNESDGTQRLFQLAGHIISTLNYQLNVFSDELDLRLHPLLSEWLLEFFHNYKKDSTAQMLFTTHNTELLNPELFRRDQIWFAEKGHSDGASSLFSLSDYKARKGENFRKNYLDGRYGAIPILQKFDMHK
ncbi:MAG: ATP-binding protein, partial [bacterium]